MVTLARSPKVTSAVQSIAQSVVGNEPMQGHLMLWRPSLLGPAYSCPRSEGLPRYG